MPWESRKGDQYCAGPVHKNYQGNPRKILRLRSDSGRRFCMHGKPLYPCKIPGQYVTTKIAEFLSQTLPGHFASASPCYQQPYTIPGVLQWVTPAFAFGRPDCQETPRNPCTFAFGPHKNPPKVGRASSSSSSSSSDDSADICTQDVGLERKDGEGRPWASSPSQPNFYFPGCPVR